MGAASTKIPAGMAGLTIHEGPAPSGAPWADLAVPVNCIRDHDWTGRSGQIGIETAPGVYDWRDFDWLVAKCIELGASLSSTVCGTPAFYASTTEKDPYGQPGGASIPRDLSTLERYAEAKVRRANRRGSPGNPTGKLVMRTQMAWNEPASGFLAPLDWGNAAKIARAVYRGTKAGDARVRVACPSMMAHRPEDFEAFLSADDGAGGRGKDWLDVVGLHLYNQYLDLGQARATFDAFDEIQRRHGLRLPYVLTEVGAQYEWPSEFRGRPDTRARDYFVSGLYAASRGAVERIFYAWRGDSTFAMAEDQALCAAHARLHALAGKAVQPFEPGDRRAKISGKWVGLQAA